VIEKKQASTIENSTFTQTVDDKVLIPTIVKDDRMRPEDAKCISQA
jgi:hypothetical protein